MAVVNGGSGEVKILPSFKNPEINGIKKCNICGAEKPISEFYIYKGHPRGHCKTCNYEMVKRAREKTTPEQRSEYWQKSWDKPEYRARKYKSAKERQSRIKKKCVEYLGGKCSSCGYSKCNEALEFHHKDPATKDYELSKGRGVDTRKSFETLRPELDKCILLCANCHREEHHEKRR